MDQKRFDVKIYNVSDYIDWIKTKVSMSIWPMKDQFVANRI